MYASIYLFADDAKIFRHVKTSADQSNLQQACNTISKWSDKWLLPLNVGKCILLRIGRETQKYEYDYYINVKDTTTNATSLQRVDSVKDLGILVDDKLNFKEHTTIKINKAFSMLGIIKRNFKHMESSTLLKLYKTMVRSHLDYAISVWAPHHKQIVDNIERVQRRATKLISKCRNLCYKDRLKLLKLPTLAYRRVRGDMIEVYKILTGKYDCKVLPYLHLSESMHTRGNAKKLQTIRTKYDSRKYFFSIRIVSVWNSLPDEVIEADSVNAFKKALDCHWHNEDIMYDYKAKLTGTGVRGLEI